MKILVNLAEQIFFDVNVYCGEHDAVNMAGSHHADDSSATALATSSVKKKGAELEQKEKSELVIVAPTMPPPLRLYSNSDR